MSIVLILTYDCNKSCSYCFQKEINKKRYLGINNFLQFMNWCMQNKLYNLRLCGGEPTLHPNFKSIVKILTKFQFKITLLSNLVFNKEIDTIINCNIKSVLVNCDRPSNYTKTQLQKFIFNLDRLSKSKVGVTLGYTLSHTNLDTGYFFDYVKNFEIQKIRFDVARPNVKKNNDFISFKELFHFKYQILEFIKRCDEYNAKMHFDCPLPKCLFSEIEITKYALYDKGLHHNKCGNIVVNPNLKIATCPLNLELDKKIIDFKTLTEANNFLKENEILKHYMNYDHLLKKCYNCISKKDKECIGYCVNEKVLL